MLFRRHKPEDDTIDPTEAVDILVDRLNIWSDELRQTLEFLKNERNGSKTVNGTDE